MTDEDAQALDTARQLTAAGIPVFVAYPDPEGRTQSGKATGYSLPKGWENTTPNPAYVDAWQPGRALVAVMGHGLDLTDIDPRNGGDASTLTGMLPPILGVASSPSGGIHMFVASMGVRSRDGVLPGVDVKAGEPDGTGRGFAFIAPTIRVSKVTGEPATYQWIKPPDLSHLGNGSGSASQLAELVRQAHGSRKLPPAGLNGFSQPADRKHTGPIPYGEHHSQLVSYAGWLRSKAIPLHPEAETLMLRRRQDVVQPSDASRPVYTEEEALTELHDIYSRYEAGDPAAEQATTPGSVPTCLPDYDLGALAAKGIKEPERIASGMLYPASVHCLAGAPGGGKTTLMAWWMLTHIRDGGHVMLLDEESGPEQAAEKFLDLGAKPEELSPPHFTYVPFPARGWNLTDLAQLHELITAREPGIIGWDSTAAFLAIAGADENSATDVTAFWQRVLVPCARQFGAAVIAIDHIIKNGEHGGYGRGSGAKKAASDVQYILETVRAFNRKQDGALKLTTAPGKDRRGWLEVAYDIQVQIGDVITLTTMEGLTFQNSAREKMSPAKANLWEALNAIATADVPMNSDQLVDWIVRNRWPKGHTRQTCSKELNELAEEGLADCSDPGPGRHKLWWPLTDSDNRTSNPSRDTPPIVSETNDLTVPQNSRSSPVSASRDASPPTRQQRRLPLRGADDADDADASSWPPGSMGAAT